jgi:ATP-dependent helicase/nuclease subunit B
VEAAGELTFDIGGRPFTVTAKADRIEPTADGLAHILDYKTGAAPSKKQVETGFSPQLTLTAAILREGGFPGMGKPSRAT